MPIDCSYSRYVTVPAYQYDLPCDCWSRFDADEFIFVRRDVSQMGSDRMASALFLLVLGNGTHVFSDASRRKVIGVTHDSSVTASVPKPGDSNDSATSTAATPAPPKANKAAHVLLFPDHISVPAANESFADLEALRQEWSRVTGSEFWEVLGGANQQPRGHSLAGAPTMGTFNAAAGAKAGAGGSNQKLFKAKRISAAPAPPPAFSFGRRLLSTLGDMKRQDKISSLIEPKPALLDADSRRREQECREMTQIVRQFDSFFRYNTKPRAAPGAPQQHPLSAQPRQIMPRPAFEQGSGGVQAVSGRAPNAGSASSQQQYGQQRHSAQTVLLAPNARVIGSMYDRKPVSLSGSIPLPMATFKPASASGKQGKGRSC